MWIPVAGLPALTFASNPRRIAIHSYPIRRSFRIRWSDTENGRVSRVGMSHFFEDMRVVSLAHFEKAVAPKFRGMLRAITIEHIAPAIMDSPLELTSGIAAIGKTSFTYALAAFQNGRCVAVGSATDVQVADGRPIVLAVETRRVLGQHLMPDASVDTPTGAPAQQHGYRWSLELHTRFSDTDLVGHLNNVSIFRYHDNAAIAFMRDALGQSGREAEDEGLSIIRQEVSFALETHYPGRITMGVAVQEIQPHWFTLMTASTQGDRRTTTATAIVMWLDKQGPAQELPDALVTRLRNSRNVGA